MHNFSRRLNLRHLGELLVGAKGLLEVVTGNIGGGRG